MATSSQPVPVSKTMVWAGRGISALCVLFLVFDGVAKLFMPPPVVEACAKLGIPEHIVPDIGVLLLACTVVYALPPTSVLGAILLTGYLGGAVATHVRVEDSAFPVAFGAIFGVLVWVGLFLREPRLRVLIPFRRAAA
ncbi:MAG: hypothetical protein JWO38_3675 [Gemmataceae bacterium]|nr:hypothetical protein [Gemmataceae bacterium]